MRIIPPPDPNSSLLPPNSSLPRGEGLGLGDNIISTLNSQLLTLNSPSPSHAGTSGMYSQFLSGYMA